MEQDEKLKEISQADIDRAATELLESLRNKPTRYKITVVNSKPLPKSLKEKEVIEFIIKPPTMSTLTEIGLVIKSLPPELFEPENSGMTKQAMEHVPSLVEIIAIMAHGHSEKKMPEWYIPFLMDNLTIEETLQLWFECSQKLKTDFFLPFFQVADRMNPMTMKSRKGSTPTQ